jgi:hypothetical protein
MGIKCTKEGRRTIKAVLKRAKIEETDKKM